MALITNIQGYSIHDGPGIRTVVFFKGCSLACQWCANPENLSPESEIGFIQKLCQGCGKCFAACLAGALNPDPAQPRIDYEKCTACGKCADVCYYKAMVRYGEEMSVEEVFDQVRRDKMFYEGSGGGVTISGGEPLLYADFAHALFTLCKEEEIDTCIETCGFVSQDRFGKILPVADHFLFDLKHMDSAKHEQYTAHPNELILSNAAYLAGHGADVLFRIPLIPGANDDMENIRRTADFVKSIGNAKIQLMPFHRIGQSKYQALNRQYSYERTEAMEKEDVDAVMRAYLDLGVDCTVSR